MWCGNTNDTFLFNVFSFVRILHRDLKPENMMVYEDANIFRLKVVDFGLSRAFNLPVRQYSPEVGRLTSFPLQSILYFLEILLNLATKLLKASNQLWLLAKVNPRLVEM